MQITTTPGIDGRRITRCCGIVVGEVILGANLFKDLFAGIRDLVGGRRSWAPTPWSASTWTTK